MKSKTRYSIIGLALIVGLVTLTAEPDANAPQAAEKQAPDHFAELDDDQFNVRTEFEYIEMPLATMAALMADESATKTDVALRARVAELVKAGKATLIEQTLLTCPNGQKATTESIREFIYPTEYEPPELPNTIHIHSNGTKADETAIAAAKEVATGPTPTAFETRNLGTTLEIEPHYDQETGYISLRFAPEIVYYIENTIYSEWRGHHGKSDIVMPVMYSLRVTTALNLASGKPTLVTALSPKNDKGVTDLSRKVLVFAKATVIPVK